MVQTNSYCRGFIKNKLNETDQTVSNCKQIFLRGCTDTYNNMKDNTERITKGVTKQGSVV